VRASRIKTRHMEPDAMTLPVSRRPISTRSRILYSRGQWMMEDVLGDHKRQSITGCP
jgi:hypothetical protein